MPPLLMFSVRSPIGLMSPSANHSRGCGAGLLVGRYWTNSWGSPVTPVAHNDSTSNVLPLRWDASTKYDDGVSVTQKA